MYFFSHRAQAPCSLLSARTYLVTCTARVITRGNCMRSRVGSLHSKRVVMERVGVDRRPPPTPARSPLKPVAQTPLRPHATPFKTPGRRPPPVTPARTLGRTPAGQPSPPVRRLVIHKLVLQDFKSYAGRQEIGPFHKSFSSIVGPNGSGKSNVIDALLFVFGWRANKMRQGRLGDLIHNRDGANPPSQCVVEVWFREIIDYPDSDDFDVVPDSQLVLKRFAQRNNTSQYTLNDKRSSFTEITDLLRHRGIDLDHKRFLILQGEVESIAQMPPKGKTEHEEGLLEYLEDLIGTSDYKTPIEEHAKAVDAANEARNEKMNRLKIVQRELEGLEPRRKEAELFLRDQNDLMRLQSRLWQAHMWDCRTLMAHAAGSLVSVQQRIEAEEAKHTEAESGLTSVREQHKAQAEACAQMEQQARELTREMEKTEKHGVELNARQKMLSGKRKKLANALSEAKSAASEARASASTAAETIATVQREQSLHESALAKEESALESVCERLRHKTQGFSDKIEQKQKELAPWTAKINEHQSARDVVSHEREWLLSHNDEAMQRVEDARASLADVQRHLQVQTEEKESLLYEQRTILDTVDEDRARVSSMQEEEETLRKKFNQARRAAEDARHAMESNKSRGEVLSSLIRQAELGLLMGFHGRLGSLGTIHPRYDIAISTACPGLNNLVVEDVTTGQQCIEHLRKHKLGRANFILLKSLQVNPKSMTPIATPENAPRLFDLVTPKDPRFASAFYHQLGDTLVARDLAQANRIAYGAKRWRVVTEDGQLIDKSGTMSGGGTRVIRGAMSSKLSAEVSPEQAARLEKELGIAQGSLQSHSQSMSQLTTLLQKNEARLPDIERQLTMLDMEIQATTQRVSEAEDRLHEAQTQSEPDQEDVRRMKELDQQWKYHDEQITMLKDKSAVIEQAISQLEEDILEAGGVALRTQQSKVQGVKDMISLCTERLSKAEEQHARAQSDHRRHEKIQGTSEAQLETLDEELQSMSESQNAQASQVATLRQQFDDLQIELEDRADARNQLQAELDGHESTLRAFRALMMDLTQQREDHEKAKTESERQLAHWTAKHASLALHPLSNDEGECVKEEDTDELPELSEDDARSVDKTHIQADMARLEERLAANQVNLDVLEEFRNVEEAFLSRAKDLEQTTEQRDKAQQRFEALRKERLDRFMEGFSQISLKLKEMYQTITLGGNAELELVDSLDPFSEGIVFSVMPPKKTWKNISYLSGGEKTLSSLALVFALHAYKPTPLYVMDEIDAALDFRNVSIIANIIKERTRGAQFVVISLRNNMFELSSRLVGVYKTAHCTKSLTIDNTDLHKSEGPSSTSGSPSKPLGHKPALFG